MRRDRLTAAGVLVVAAGFALVVGATHREGASAAHPTPTPAPTPQTVLQPDMWTIEKPGVVIEYGAHETLQVNGWVQHDTFGEADVTACSVTVSTDGFVAMLPNGTQVPESPVPGAQSPALPTGNLTGCHRGWVSFPMKLWPVTLTDRSYQTTWVIGSGYPFR